MNLKYNIQIIKSEQYYTTTSLTTKHHATILEMYKAKRKWKGKTNLIMSKARYMHTFQNDNTKLK